MKVLMIVMGLVTLFSLNCFSEELSARHPPAKNQHSEDDDRKEADLSTSTPTPHLHHSAINRLRR